MTLSEFICVFAAGATYMFVCLTLGDIWFQRKHGKKHKAELDAIFEKAKADLDGIFEDARKDVDKITKNAYARFEKALKEDNDRQASEARTEPGQEGDIPGGSEAAGTSGSSG